MNVVVSDPNTWIFYRVGLVMVGSLLILALSGIVELLDSRTARMRGVKPSVWWMPLLVVSGFFSVGVIALNMNAAFSGQNPGVLWFFYAPVAVAPALRLGLRYAFPLRSTSSTRRDRC